MDNFDEPARRAMEAHIKEPLGVRFKRILGEQPLEILIAVLCIAALAALTAFEANNSARGWVLLTKGAAPGPLAYAAGIAVTIGYIIFHRQASEEYRAGAFSRMSRAVMAAIVLACLSLMGVFGNIASKTAGAAEGAKEHNLERSDVMVRVRNLERQINQTDGAFLSAMVEADKSALESTLAEATGWGMKNLDPEGSCAQDLKPRQRQLCNAANGTAGLQGLTGQIKINEAALVTYEENLAELETARAKMSGMSRAEGDAHWDAMASLSGGNVEADKFRIWGSFLASLLFLMGCGMGWDYLFERGETHEEPA